MKWKWIVTLLFVGLPAFADVTVQVAPKTIKEDARSEFLTQAQHFRVLVYYKNNFQWGLWHAGSNTEPVELDNFRNIEQVKWLKYVMLYEKFSLEEAVRWLDWSLVKTPVTELESKGVVDYLTIGQNSQRDRLTLALVNLLIQRRFGLKFLAQVQRLTEKYLPEVLEELKVKDKPSYAWRNEVAAALYDRVVPELDAEK